MTFLFRKRLSVDAPQRGVKLMIDLLTAGRCQVISINQLGDSIQQKRGEVGMTLSTSSNQFEAIFEE